MRHEMNTKRNYVSNKIDIFKELATGFNIPNVHLMTHSAKLSCPYGALQQYSANSDAHVHTMNLQDGKPASTPSRNYLPQAVTI